MTDKTVSTTKVEAPAADVKKAPARKPAAKKTAAKKPAARKVAVKKAPARTTKARKPAPQQTVFSRIEDSVIAVPFKAANKTFMASIGLLSFVQKEIDKQYREFDKKFSKYAKDGEKVLDGWEDRVEYLRKDVEKKVDEARDRVKSTFKSAA
jgi:hypothetical protein